MNAAHNITPLRGIWNPCSGEREDYNDADDTDHDRWWLWEIGVCIVISWGCAVWALTAVGVG